LFFLSYSPISFLASGEFESEGFEHLVCSCHCIRCICLSCTWWYMEVKVFEPFPSGAYTWRFFMLGLWALDGLVTLAVFLRLPIKFRRFLNLEAFCGWFPGRLQLSCGDFPKIVRIWWPP
jgi:hypothetical protein